MTDSVVCGVDISDAARPVVDTARWLADGIGARLLVVHVVEEAVSEAEEFANILRGRLSTGDHEVRTADGSPATALLSAVEDEHADFLVVGSCGQSPLGAGLFGSVSQEVAASAHSPVVVVPARMIEAFRANGASHSIVCGVDGSEHALAAARVAGELARSLDCRLILVHALQDLAATAAYLGARATNPPLSAQPDVREKQAAQIVRDALDLLGGDATGVVESGSPWTVLDSIADREAGWLLVVAARGRGAMRSAVFGSVAARLATTAGRPVVMVPEPMEPE